MRSLTLCCLITLISSFLVGQQPSTPSLTSPESTVNGYCQQDFLGARTRSGTSSKVDHLILWETEPGWDTVTVVHNFKVLSATTQGNRAVVLVEYESLGEIAGWQFLAKPKKERVEFKLKLGDKEWTWKNDEPVLVHSTRRWRITEPVMQPHISLGYAIEHVNWLIRTQDDPEHQLTRTLAELKSLRSGRDSGK